MRASTRSWRCTCFRSWRIRISCCTSCIASAAPTATSSSSTTSARITASSPPSRRASPASPTRSAFGRTSSCATWCPTQTRSRNCRASISSGASCASRTGWRTAFPVWFPEGEERRRREALQYRRESIKQSRHRRLLRRDAQHAQHHHRSQLACAEAAPAERQRTHDEDRRRGREHCGVGEAHAGGERAEPEGGCREDLHEHGEPYRAQDRPLRFEGLAPGVFHPLDGKRYPRHGK